MKTGTWDAMTGARNTRMPRTRTLKNVEVSQENDLKRELLELITQGITRECTENIMVAS